MADKIIGKRVILLDIDNTLLDFNKGSEAAMRICLEGHGIAFCEGIYHVFKKINDELWQKIERKELTKSELHEIRWCLVFEELGIDLDGKAFELEFLETLKTSSVPIEGAFELLSYLRERYMVCAASNAPYEQQIARLTSCGMIDLFDKLFISEKVGYPKPSPSFFDAVFDELEYEKADAVMIGDSLTADIYGGREYGLSTVWFNFEKSEVPKDLGDTVIVSSLWEIMEIL